MNFKLLKTSGVQLAIVWVILYCFFGNIELRAIQQFCEDFVCRPAHKYFGDNASFMVLVFGTQILHLTTFWTHCAILAVIDFHPNLFPGFTKWKVQPGKNQPLESKKFWECVQCVLVNQVFVNFTLAMALYYAYSKFGIGFQVASSTFPTLKIIVRDYGVFFIVEEIFFYYGHRLMHSPYLYKAIHKKHHEWTAPIGCSSTYCHPFEHLTCNLFPVVLGPLIMKSHLFTYWSWLTLAVFSTIVSHSGYHFPFIASPEFHDFHHLNFNSNFGVFEILDLLHGTSVQFENTPQIMRNKVFYSLGDFKLMLPCKNK